MFKILLNLFDIGIALVNSPYIPILGESHEKQLAEIHLADAAKGGQRRHRKLRIEL